MSASDSIWTKFRSLFLRKRAERELDAEMQFDLEHRTAAHIAVGMNAHDAKLAALREFGSVSLAMEECRDARSTRFFDNAFHDLRYALRVLAKKPAFTVLAILTLALGIGANSAIFSVVNAVLIRPLPFRDSGKLMLLYESIPDLGFPKLNFSAPDLRFFQAAQQSFLGTASFVNQGFVISGAGVPERVSAARGQWNLFDVLGVQPIVGRTFSPEEDAPGHHVTMLSYGLWQSKFGGSADAIGKTLDLDRTPYTVIGVLPPDFVFPLPGMLESNTHAALWVPMAFTPEEEGAWGQGFNDVVVARLKPGVTAAAAQSESDAIAQRIRAAYPAKLMQAFHNPTLKLAVAPMQHDIVGEIRPLLFTLQAAVALVLLIACANVALLLLARASGRSHEIAIRAALGASRVRLVMQLLAESLVLATAGAIAGLALAYWSKAALLKFLPSSITLPNVTLDWRVLAFTLGVAAAAAILFGLAPSFEASRAKAGTALHEAGRGGSASLGRHRLQNVFVIAEFALALILMIGAGLLLRTFTKLLRTNPGFQPQNVLVMTVPLPVQAYPKASQVRSFYQQAIANAAQLPGVTSVSATNDVPLNSNETDALVTEGTKDLSQKFPAVVRTWIVGNYLETMGIPLLRGRAISAEDQQNTLPVALVSENLARAIWPGEDPIGKRVRVEGADSPWRTIVGVVGDVPDTSLAAAPEPHVYTAYLQEPDSQFEGSISAGLRSLTLSVRTRTQPEATAAALVGQIRNMDASLAVAHTHTMQSDVTESVAPQRFNATLVGIYAGAALLLALIGIYGVLAYTVSQQLHDIGVRIAIGAKSSDILALVLRRGLILAAIGAAIGLAGASVVTRFMATLLYGVQPRDPWTFVSVTLVMVITALLACYIPARRATRVDPIIALRCE